MANLLRSCCVTLLSAGIVVALSACTGLRNDVSGVVDAPNTHKIMVTSQFVTTPIAVPANASALAPAEEAKLAKAVAEFVQIGGDTLEIAVPKGTDSGEQAMARANIVRRHALMRGALAREIAVRFSDIADNGPVVISYEKFKATPAPCRPTTQNMAYNPRNYAQDTFGCTTQHNLAISISNPADLLGRQSERPPDAERRDAIIRAYRSGENPSSDAGADPGL